VMNVLPARIEAAEGQELVMKIICESMGKAIAALKTIWRP